MKKLSQKAKAKLPPPIEERRKDGSLVWSRRIAEQRPSDHARYIVSLLNTLEKLEASTRPSGGPKTEAGKDVKAFEAMTVAGELVSAVAGWAIDHQIGLALAGLEFVPLAGSNVKAMPEYQDALSSVNSHNLEREGGAVVNGIAPERLRPHTVRKIVSGALLANLAGLPREISRLTREGLEALEWGEVLPIFQPVTTQAHVRFTGLRCQLLAMCFIEFEKAAGRKTKKQAIDAVADAFCVSDDGVRNWPKRVRAELGSLIVARQLEYARNGGRLDAAGHSSTWSTEYSEPKMKEAGALYRSIKGAE